MNNATAKASAALKAIEAIDNHDARVALLAFHMVEVYEDGRTQGFADGYNERDAEDDIGE